MSIARRLSDNRSVVILIVLVSLSLVTLASGTQASFIAGNVRRVVSIVASPVLLVLHNVQAAAGYTKDFFVEYGQPRQEATALRLELNEATKRIAELQDVSAENARLKQMLDFAQANPNLELVPAAVLDEYDGILTIDRGSVHGIEINMSVMSKDGVVGVVIEALPLVSKVATLHRSECKIGAVVANSRVRGVVHGTGMDASYVCSLQYIDLKDNVNRGDVVVTGGGGGVYPSGYVIGRIKEVTQDTGSLLQTAFIEPAADPYRLDEVFLVKRAQTPVEELALSELPALPEPEVDVAAAPKKPKMVAPALPDTRTLQQQLAP